MNYGLISLLPIFVILVVSITTRRTLMALFFGTITGGLILSGTGLWGSWVGYFGNVMADETFQWLVIVISLFGILIAVFERSGVVNDFAIWSEKYVTTKKRALFMTYFLGIIIFLDDYLNNMVVGTTMKNISDKYNTPRTLLGYIVNSVSAPVCVLIPLSTWAVFFGGLLEDQGILVNGSGMGAYIQSIPFIFYGWIALIVVALVIMGIIPPLGVLKQQIKTAEEKGYVFPEREVYAELNELIKERTRQSSNKNDKTTQHAKPYNFLIPIIVMIIVTIAFDIDVQLGTAAGLLTAFVLYAAQGLIKWKEIGDLTYQGINSMLFVIVLTALAFTVQHMNLDLGVADYVIEVTEPIMHGAFLPAIVFLVCAVYAYATGSFWDLAAIIMPIVVPLALAVGVDPILASAAVFSGAAFGSNTCLYGDGMILAARSTDLQNSDLMVASLPYAGLAGAISFVLYLIAGFIMF